MLLVDCPLCDGQAPFDPVTGELDCPDFTVRIVVLATSSKTPRERDVLLDVGAPS